MHYVSARMLLKGRLNITHLRRILVMVVGQGRVLEGGLQQLGGILGAASPTSEKLLLLLSCIH